MDFISDGCDFLFTDIHNGGTIIGQSLLVCRLIGFGRLPAPLLELVCKLLKI
jgi:hypothetical protein